MLAVATHHPAACASRRTCYQSVRSRRHVSDQGVLVAVLNRDDWYDIARDVEWTLSYVTHKDAFPVEWQGAAGIPRDAWRAGTGDRRHDPVGLLDDRPYDPALDLSLDPSLDPSRDPSRDRD